MLNQSSFNYIIVNMDNFLIYILSVLIIISNISEAKIYENNQKVRKFPNNFAFGVSTSSYQIEGAWNVSGKSENIWDTFTHFNPSMIYNKSNGDIACNSYYEYKRDVEMLKELHVDFYRFSLSWSRILPTGSVAYVNQDGIKYYNRLIDSLIESNIIPFVTLYHWDLPQSLQNLGGWTNPLIQDYFEDYANLVFTLFGDRVKHWITFNEPKEICLDGYGKPNRAPAVNISGIGEYMCGHNLLNSHAKVFHLYDSKYRNKQQGIIGITVEATWGEPSSTLKEDVDAAERFIQFDSGWFWNPIFSFEGDYPKIMKDRIAIKSIKQGFHKSRLPEFTSKERKMLQRSSDFLGLNFYSSLLVKHNVKKDNSLEPSYDDDQDTFLFVNKSWPGGASDWLKVTPWAFVKLLRKIKIDYNNPEVIITENGYSTWGGLFDNDRISYINLHLNALLDAIDEGSNVSAYSVWSLMDNFEWTSGYSERFGLYEVDFNSPTRKRRPRNSAKYYSSVIKTKSVKSYDPEYDELKSFSNAIYI